MKSRRPLLSFDDLDEVHRLWFYGLFFTDLRMVRSAARHAVVASRSGDNGADPHGVYQALNDAAIVRYGRCFLGCVLPDGMSKTRLPPRYVFEGPLGDCHAKVMAMRHGLVAHSDLRERRVILRKGRENEQERWRIAASGGVMVPNGLMLLGGLCDQLRKLVIAEARPLIEKQIAAMRAGDEVDLAAFVENAQPRNISWIDDE